MSCSNQVVRFALSDIGPLGFDGVTGFDITTKIQAGAVYGLLARGCTQVGGVCSDYSGNIYISDAAQHCIIKVDESGRVTNFAGLPGTSGNNDTAVSGITTPKRVPCNDSSASAGDGARFNEPWGICCDKSNRIYVADYGNHQIRVIDSGYVSAVAGLATTSGFVDGSGITARFNNPKGIAVDNSGNLFVVDHTNHALRKISPRGNVVTVAGNGSGGDGENITPTAAGTGWTGPSRVACLQDPWDVCVDPKGIAYILDSGNNKIKKLLPNGTLLLHSGSGTSGHSLGTAGTTAATAQPYTCTYGLLTFCSMDKSGNMYVVDRLEGWTRLLLVAGNGVPAEIADFHGSAYVDCPIGVTVTPAQKIYVTFSNLETGVSSSSSSSSSSA